MFDKTGTLTTGKLSVQKVYVRDESKMPIFEFLSYVASLESNSEHAVARAVVDYVKEKNIKFSTPTSFQSIVGRGVTGNVQIPNRKTPLTITIGTLDFIKSCTPITKEEEEENFLSLCHDQNEANNMIIYVRVDQELVGAIELSDTLKEEAYDVIQYLKQCKYEIWILSGDTKSVTNALADKLEIDYKNACGGMLPQDKMNKIKELQDQGKVVAMIGDGINDSPSLSQVNFKKN